LAGVKAELKPTTSAAYAAPARRPPYSVLDGASLQAAGVPPLRGWKEALADYLKERADRPPAG
jgi:dTDP-4-dehydrorhamnose reductase